ncbi:tripartite tricarboxylate transporter substrate binding protein [Polynucleobacter sp. UB-Piko-W3]|uniref:tripartite tricarboxylate transporter substrate binding protein n=1 Tax=Polynucleobacter sp. UB-Piko-W3 TaxID=1819735 RepID=UPI001C0AC556|nr:tripartite tricarboxylate transporter substrate binding protein [Polynucleobacter sp. UB-Piko-W3]MBU3554334.1 tripartite tricarboxylate transporter substrate binding protein [Polynucleobacter sp. UB-Piko-W3]
MRHLIISLTQSLAKGLFGLSVIYLLQSPVLAQTVTKLIVPTAPGGGTDALFRVVSKDAQRFIGGPISIQNVAGAGGTIGLAQVINSTPDGYTLAGVWPAPVTVVPQTSKVPYTPSDYIPVIQLSTAPYIFCVRPDFPANDGKALMEELRKNPKKYTYGTDGLGGPAQLAAERIFRTQNIQTVDVPYKGAGETIIGFLSNQIDIYVGSIPPVLQHANVGKAKCLLVSSVNRNAQFPNASSLKDLGLAKEETLLWRVILAPKDTKPERINQIVQAYSKAMKEPDTLRYLDESGESSAVLTGKELQDKLTQEYAAFSQIVKSLNLAK